MLVHNSFMTTAETSLETDGCRGYETSLETDGCRGYITLSLVGQQWERKSSKQAYKLSEPPTTAGNQSNKKSSWLLSLEAFLRLVGLCNHTRSASCTSVTDDVTDIQEVEF